MQRTFPDRDDVRRRVDACLARAVPDTFRVEWRGDELGWVLEKVVREPGEWPTQDYLLWLTAGGDWLVATYDNCDAGMPPPSQRALVLDTRVLLAPEWLGDRDPLASFVRRLLSLPTNRWGFT